MADRPTPPLPKEPGWKALHDSLQEVRTLCSDLGVRLRALAEVWEEISRYDGADEFQRGTARTYEHAAREIRLIMGEEEG